MKVTVATINGLRELLHERDDANAKLRALLEQAHQNLLAEKANSDEVTRKLANDVKRLEDEVSEHRNRHGVSDNSELQQRQEKERLQLRLPELEGMIKEQEQRANGATQQLHAANLLLSQSKAAHISEVGFVFVLCYL
jgi:hypothetical protein